MGLPDRPPPLSALVTGRLVLEPWAESRREDLARLATIPEVVRHIGDGEIWSRERADEVFDRNLRHWDEHGFGWRSALDRESGAWLGFLGLSYVPGDAVDSSPERRRDRLVASPGGLGPRARHRGCASGSGRGLRARRPAPDHRPLRPTEPRVRPDHGEAGDALRARQRHQGTEAPVRIYALDRRIGQAAAAP